jgi:hypothetical protein
MRIYLTEVSLSLNQRAKHYVEVLIGCGYPSKGTRKIAFKIAKKNIKWYGMMNKRQKWRNK